MVASLVAALTTAGGTGTVGVGADQSGGDEVDLVRGAEVDMWGRRRERGFHPQKWRRGRQSGGWHDEDGCLGRRELDGGRGRQGGDDGGEELGEVV